jgi:hypothetical protein
MSLEAEDKFKMNKAVYEKQSLELFFSPPLTFQNVAREDFDHLQFFAKSRNIFLFSARSSSNTNYQLSNPNPIYQESVAASKPFVVSVLEE